MGGPADWDCTNTPCIPMSNELPQGILELPGGNILSPEFASNNFVVRLVYLFVAGLIVRARYYFAWLTAEAAFNIAGYGYDDKAKDSDPSAFFNLFPKWNKMANVDIVRGCHTCDHNSNRFVLQHKTQTDTSGDEHVTKFDGNVEFQDSTLVGIYGIQACLGSLSRRSARGSRHGNIFHFCTLARCVSRLLRMFHGCCSCLCDVDGILPKTSRSRRVFEFEGWIPVHFVSCLEVARDVCSA